MTVDLRKIKKLIELVEESGITELEVKDGDETIRIGRAPSPGVGAAPAQVSSPAAEVEQPRSAATGSVSSGFVVSAPLAGTFYRAPAPGERPYVSAGQDVAVGDVLCIIESMKMMNQIEAEQAGRIVEVLVDDAQPIEAGHVLFRIEVAA